MDNIKKYIKKINDIWQKLINNKFFNKVFLFLPQNIFIFILLLISLGLIFSFYLNHNAPIYKQVVLDGVYDGILTEAFTYDLNNIKEKVASSEMNNNIDKICITFATYAHRVNAKYNYKVIKNNEKIYEKEFNALILKDGKPYCFSIPEATKENIGEYTILLEPINAKEKDMITIFKNTETNEPTMSLVSKEFFFSNPILISILVFFIIISFAINYFINKKKLSSKTMWLIFSLFYILPITFLNPPYEVPDEPKHLHEAIRLTQFDKDKNFYENINNKDFYLPQDIGCLGYANISRRDKVVSQEEVKKCLENTQNFKTRSPYDRVPHEIAFLAPSIGLKLGDILTNSSLIIFYMGRLFNALLSIFIIYKALKIAPKHKEILLLVATLPMFIQQLASYSYDSILNSFSILATSVTLKMIYEKDISYKKSTILLLLAGLFIGNIKSIYVTIFLMLLFIPNDKFKNKSHKYIYTLFIILSSLLLGKISTLIFLPNNFLNIFVYSIIFSILALFTYLSLTDKMKQKKIKYAFIIGVIICLLGGMGLKFINSSKVIEDSVIENIEEISVPELKIKSLIENPFKVVTLAFNTLKMNTMNYLRGIVGYFGWVTYKMEDIYLIAYLLLAIYIIKNTKFIKVNLIDKALNIIGVLISIAAVFLAMYLHWSDISLPYIDGVQGRYFLPLLPIILILFMSHNRKQEKDITKNVYLFINVVLLNYICLLISFFY